MMYRLIQQAGSVQAVESAGTWYGGAGPKRVATSFVPLMERAEEALVARHGEFVLKGGVWDVGFLVAGLMEDCDSEKYVMGRDGMREVRMMCVGLEDGVV